MLTQRIPGSPLLYNFSNLFVLKFHLDSKTNWMALATLNLVRLFVPPVMQSHLGRKNLNRHLQHDFKTKCIKVRPFILNFPQFHHHYRCMTKSHILPLCHKCKWTEFSKPLSNCLIYKFVQQNSFHLMYNNLEILSSGT